MPSNPQIASFNRRELLQRTSLGLLAMNLGGLSAPPAEAAITTTSLPDEPLEIGSVPQFVFDLYAVDCTWALKEKHEPVRRMFHRCQKHAANPLLTGDQPSHFAVARDEPNGPFRMWYQVNQPIEYPGGRAKGQAQFRTFIGYAESSDGIAWERPNLDFYGDPTGKTVPRNCVLYRPDSPQTHFGIPQIVDVPQRDRRDYRYVMLYLAGGSNRTYRGIRLVGSRDGVRWDLEHDALISAIGSDHHNTIVHDPKLNEYVLYLRAKDIYLAPGQGRDRVDTGQSRRGVARMASKELWSEWKSRPQTIMVPDEVDAEHGYNYFYGMPLRREYGIYWGFLQSFRMNDYMHSELATSRDGIRFERLPSRPKIVEYGADGTWDDTMILASPRWIEVGDEWWIYYCGFDGPHGIAERTGGIGLAKLRKEGFISLRGPKEGGVVCTRQMRWPGGELRVNADARDGQMRVRVSDAYRKPLAGFDYEQSPTIRSDSVAHEIRWNGRSLAELNDQVVRLEFLLHDADLYTFRATGEA